MLTVTSSELREHGNKLFRTVTADMAPALQQALLAQAKDLYLLAARVAGGDGSVINSDNGVEYVSAMKNAGCVSKRLSHVSSSEPEKLDNILDAIACFSGAHRAGLLCKDASWLADCIIKVGECFELLKSAFEGCDAGVVRRTWSAAPRPCSLQHTIP
jgi:hypothetical protein